MLITYTGPGNALDLAFYNTISNNLDLQVVSLSSTQIVLRNPSNGVVTTITGTGFPLTDVFDQPNPPGTVTGWHTTTAGGASIARVQNISWTTGEFITAMVQLFENDNDAALIALVNRTPVTLNATGSASGTQDLQFGGLTSAVIIFSSPGPDVLQGGNAGDTVTFVSNTGDGDTVYATPGNDRYVFTPVTEGGSWVDLVYRDLPGPISVTINGFTNTGTIAKSGQGTDTLVDVNTILDWDTMSLNLWGTAGNDSFTINGGPESWLRIVGGAGQDSYNLTLAGDMRLTLGVDWNSAPTAGVVINLATRQIVNDGFGNAETLILTPGAGHLELETGDLADRITGSAADDRFLTRGGNDTVDGGAGFDRLRFDGSRATSGVTVDLATGTATGTWRDVAFTKQLTSIEFIRGTDLADQIRGSAANERLEGRNGDDLLDGRGGNDTLRGDHGDDTLIGGAGNDELNGGAGNDRIEVGTSTFGGGEQVLGSAGNDTIVYSGVGTGGGWNNLTYHGLDTRIAVTINGATNTGSVQKFGPGGALAGTDTLVDVARVLNNFNDGFNLFGSHLDDSFAINGGSGSWLTIFGGRGTDNYTLTLTGTIRLDFSGTWDDWRGATQALQINLATGQIANDGFGNAETVTILGGSERLEIHGTRHADTMTGSARGEVFITGGGNDTIDGGAGFDGVRYNRSEMSAGVTVDLAAGTASGASDGVAFVQSLSGIEDVSGTRFADVLRGTANADRLRGHEGNDLLVGGDGNDTLEGGDGTDTLNGGAGDDFLFGGATDADLRDLIFGGDGNDSIDGGAGNDELNGGAGNDTMLGGLGADTLVGNEGNDVIVGGGGADFIFGNAGNDFINGGFGFDRMNGGAGADVFFHQGVADHGSDWVQDYNAAEGDLLSIGIAGATRAQFQINYANTANAGSAGIDEAFIVYRPSGQILFALIDGRAQSQINISLGGQVFDLMA